MDTAIVLNKILHSEYHLFPFRDKYILYSRNGKVLLLNKEAMQVLSWIIKNESTEGVPVTLLNGFDLVLEKPVRNEFPGNLSVEWMPTVLTVSLTNGCNLRCVYCFASAGEYTIQHLDPKIFQAAIDIIVTNAREKGRDSFKVNFLGNGESTFNWKLLLQAISIIERHATDHVKGVIHITTNGVVSTSRMRNMCDYVDSVTLSVDGVERHQCKLRPTASGKSSWQYVLRTADTLYSLGAKWELRMTIADVNVHDLEEIVEYYSKQYPGTPIRFEPMHHCGRSIGAQAKPPSAEDFLSNYIRAKRVAKVMNTPLGYSGIREVASINGLSFCGIDTPNFCLKEDGSVVACFTGMDTLLKYGEFNRSLGSFVFNKQKISGLQKLNLAHADNCHSCFAKYHCLGDCPSLRITNPHIDAEVQYSHGIGRCEINQALTKKIILSSLGINPTVEELIERR